MRQDLHLFSYEIQGRNEGRWRPGQETSLAPPSLNLRSFGSKCTVMKKAFTILLGLFGPGELCPLVVTRLDIYFTTSCRTNANKAEQRAFGQTISHRIEDHPEFLDFIFFCDEANFHLSGYVNKHNVRFGSHPHDHQYRPLSVEKVNVSCALVVIAILIRVCSWTPGSWTQSETLN